MDAGKNKKKFSAAKTLLLILSGILIIVVISKIFEFLFALIFYLIF